MRILGPDGQPIESGPPVSDEVKQFVARAKELATNGDPSSGLQQMVFAFQTDVSSNLVLDTTCELLEQMKQMAGATESEELALFQALRQDRSNPAIYHRIGNRFFQLQQAFVALPFLSRAREILGDAAQLIQAGDVNAAQLSQAIDVDSAQVLMDLGAYQQAVEAYQRLNDVYGGLPVWLLMELAQCYALQRQIDEAEAVYQIAPPETFTQVPVGQYQDPATGEVKTQFQDLTPVREEVGDMLARVRDFDEYEQMDLCDWHYVQTRGILLELNPEPDPGSEANGEATTSGRFIYFQPSEEDTAYIVGVAAALLDTKGYSPNRLLWLGETSEPLARLFAQWWEISDENIRPYQKGDNPEESDDLSLLVMAHSYNVFDLEDEESFVELAQAREGLITFAMNIRWTERQPMTPDIAGFMSQGCALPWEPRYEVDEATQTATQIVDERDAQTVAEAISAQFKTEEEFDTIAREMLEDMEACTDLILDHRDGTLIRRPFVTHSPIKSPRVGF